MIVEETLRIKRKSHEKLIIKQKIPNLGKMACQKLVAMETSSHVIKKLRHQNVRTRALIGSKS